MLRFSPDWFDGISTVQEMVEAFRSEEDCRRLLECLVWPTGRACPFCGYLRSILIRGRDLGNKARPGLYQCQAKECRRQFTVTTKTPLHSTKLPLRTWLTAMWLQLHSDKGISSVRLAEAIGVSQTTAWRIGHAIRLLTADYEKRLGGVVEADEVFVGGKPKKDPSNPEARRGKQGHTTKWPVLVAVERPIERAKGDAPGAVRAMPLSGLSSAEIKAALDQAVAPEAHLMTDGHKSFGEVGAGFAKHDTVTHSELEFARGIVHSNRAEALNDRIRRTIVGVFHHISQKHGQSYLDEIGFRWHQRVFVEFKVRKTKSGREVARQIWGRLPPTHQMRSLLKGAVGREFRRTKDGSLHIKSRRSIFDPRGAIDAAGALYRSDVRRAVAGFGEEG